MQTYVLNKNHLSFWLRRIRNGRELIAPVRDASGEIVLTELTRMHETALDGPALMPSPKEYLLPQMEQLFRWHGEGVEEAINGKRRIVFGIRPCDMSAVKILDRFYLGERPDPYYAVRRSNTVFIVLACTRPDPACFCLGLGTGPFLKEDFDIQLIDIGDRFAVEVGSETGESLVRNFQHIVTPPVDSDREDLYEAKLAAQSLFEKHVSFEQVRQSILAGHVDDTFWDSVAMRCFECGGCVYNCPVCTCFNVIDRQLSPVSGTRFRIWDACMFRGFTRTTGAAVPAERKTERIKRWFHHKLVHWPGQFGVFGCVGCGRCAGSCPAKIDMTTVALKIKGMKGGME